MNKWILTGLLLLVIAGCARAPAAAPQTTDAQVASVQTDITGVDTLDTQLDTSALDSLDKDFAAIQ